MNKQLISSTFILLCCCSISVLAETPTSNITVTNEAPSVLTLTAAQTITKYLNINYCPSTFTTAPSLMSKLLPGGKAQFTQQLSGGECSARAISSVIIYTRTDGSYCTFGITNAYYGGFSICSYKATPSNSSIICAVNFATTSQFTCQFNASISSVTPPQKSK